MQRKNSLQSHKKSELQKNKIATVDLKNYSELIVAKYQISDIKTGFMILNGFENSLSRISSNYGKLRIRNRISFFP